MKLWRSLVFWAGLAAMGSVLWGWWDSARFNSNAGTHRIYVENTNSVVFLSLNYYSNWSLGEWKVWSGWDGYRTVEVERRPMKVREISFGSRGEQVWIKVPHASLLLATAWVWVGCLMWRWWRRKARSAMKGGEV